MAIDSAAKRASALTTATPELHPIPDGTIDQGDRQTLRELYRGILAGAVTPSDILGLLRMNLKIGLGL